MSDIRLHSRSGLKFGSLASSCVFDPWCTRSVFIFKALAPSRSLISSAMKIQSRPLSLRALSVSRYMRSSGFLTPISLDRLMCLKNFVRPSLLICFRVFIVQLETSARQYFSCSSVSVGMVWLYSL